MGLCPDVLECVINGIALGLNPLLMPSIKVDLAYEPPFI